MSKHKQLYKINPKIAVKKLISWPIGYWRRDWWHKLISVLVLLLLLTTSTMYGIAMWYQHEQKAKPATLGVSFIADYATYLGLDAHQTFSAILDELHVKHVRLVSYWSDIEPMPGQYDFSELDWEMAQAQAHGTKVNLSIGLRQPRYPECHPPSWVDTTKPLATWQPQLEQYLTAVVNRYKDNPALQSYQLENEFYLSSFGECHDATPARLTSEFNDVKRLDPLHPIILSRSDNLPDWPPIEPKADLTGMSVYRRVWDGNLTHRYFEYPLPSWYYAFLAGVQQIRTGNGSTLHELQAEPWPPNGKGILDISLAEQNKSFTAKTLISTTKFGKQTGLKQIDLWGAEYWYYRMRTLHDPSVWNTAEQLFTNG